MSYFNFREMCTTQVQLENYPRTMNQVQNLCALVAMLDEVREEFNAPIVINSAFRSEEVNRRVGGVRTSLHLQGRAADIRPCYGGGSGYNWELQRLYSILYKRRDDLTELIKYDTFIHVAI